jgi:DNA polymerase
MTSDHSDTSHRTVSEGEDQAAVVAQARRFLEDLVAFEGPRFIVPSSVFQPQVPPRAEAEGGTELEAFRREICECTRCPLGHSRQNFVFGQGAADAGIMFIGEAPGAQEDRQGVPFVGPAGQLLTKIIEAMQLSREEVYICNVLKCRPPGNRDPDPEEIASCEPFLKKQIAIVDPAIICALGRVAAHMLLKTTLSMRDLRGRIHQYEGVPVIVTYHPSYLLRTPSAKRDAWEDIKRLRREYDGLEL